MNTFNCLRADIQKEIFDMLCKNELDKYLQSKFGEYADIICNTKATEDGGEIYLCVGIFDIRDELVNMSEELSEALNIDSCLAKNILEVCLPLFEVSVDIEYDTLSNVRYVKLFSESPYIDEFTDTNTLNTIDLYNTLKVEEKLVACIKTFMDDFISIAESAFSSKESEYVTCNPELFI